MRFVEGIIKNQDTDTRAVGYLPNLHDGIFARPDDIYVDIEVDSVPRVAKISVIELVEMFADEDISRGLHGHDAAVLALAYMTGNDFGGVTFNAPGGKIAKVEEAVRISQEDHAQNDGVLLTASNEVDPTQYPTLVTSPNFLIRASVDDKEPLYATKAGAYGPAGLVTFEQSAKLYPVRAVWHVHQMRAVDLDR